MKVRRNWNLKTKYFIAYFFNSVNMKLKKNEATKIT